MNENEIRDVLGAGIGEEPPVGGGPAAVFAGARAHRNRTRALTGGLSMAAVLGVAAGAVAFGGGSGRAVSATDLTKAGPTSASAKPTTDPTTARTPAATSSSAKPARTTPPPNTTTPTPLARFYEPAGTAIPQNPAPQPGPGQVLMDGRSSAEILKSLLPSGLVTAGYAGQDDYDPANPGVDAGSTMTVDDGTGKPTDVDVTLVQNVARTLKITDCVSAKEMAATPISDCRAVAEPDGSVVLSYRMDDYNPDGAGYTTKGSYDNRLIRVFQNGTVLVLGASNFHIPPNPPQTKGWHVDPSRQAPLLSLDQLAGIAMSPQWGLTVPAQLAQQAKQDLVSYDDQTQH